MATKINFTQEHLAKLKDLATKMLFNGTIIKGLVGSESNIYDLVHNTTINSLITLNSNLKKEIEKISNLDEWSMNSYQQSKLETTKETQELVNLLIGYKKDLAQKGEDKAKLSELKAKYKELKESTMTPEDRLKALEAEIKSIGGEEAVE